MLLYVARWQCRGETFQYTVHALKSAMTLRYTHKASASSKFIVCALSVPNSVWESTRFCICSREHTEQDDMCVCNVYCILRRNVFCGKPVLFFLSLSFSCIYLFVIAGAYTKIITIFAAKWDADVVVVVIVLYTHTHTYSFGFGVFILMVV